MPNRDKFIAFTGLSWDENPWLKPLPQDTMQKSCGKKTRELLQPKQTKACIITPYCFAQQAGHYCEIKSVFK